MRLFQKRKTCLAVRLTADRLSLLLWDSSSSLQSETIFLRETSDEAIRDRAALFTKGQKIRETYLVLSRSEVLQKEIVPSQIQNALPVGLQEMAYGMMPAPEGPGAKHLLLAVPEKKLSEWLAPLKKWGISPDEIITEDQSFGWALAGKGGKAPVLGIELDEERMLCSAIKEGRLIFSRSFKNETGVQDFQEFFQELSLALLENGQKPEKIVLAGAATRALQGPVQMHFQLPVECLEEGADPNIPASFKGLLKAGEYPAASLLPKAEKIQKWFHAKKALARETAVCFLLCVLGFFAAFSLHEHMTQIQLKKVSSRVEELRPQTEHLKEMAASLALLTEFQTSKEGILDFLGSISSGMPSSVKLRELRIEDHHVFFKGETTLHGAITETVQLFEKSGKVQGAKLESTKLRKRLGEDYFEYEVSGQWKL